MSFNSATTFQPWKLDNACTEPLAGTVLQFGHDLSAVETMMTGPKRKHGARRFNSATTFQPWKPNIKGVFKMQSSVLQFGHDLSAVETIFIFL